MVAKPKNAREPYRCPVCSAPAIKIDREKPKLLIETADALQKLEKSIYAYLYRYVKGDPLWEGYLKHVKGVGPVLAAWLISDLHPSRFENVSKLWRYSGLHVVHTCRRCGYRQDGPGACPRCGIELVGAAPRRRAGEKAGYNVWARAMAWRLARSLAMSGGVYRELYNIIYSEAADKGARQGLSKGHIVARARRKLVKIFLSHYLEVGRRILGLPWRQPYPQAVNQQLHSYIPPLIDEVEKSRFYEKFIEPQGEHYIKAWREWIQKLKRR